MRGRVYRGSPKSMILFQPFITTKRLQQRGAIVGTKTELNELHWYHPFTLPGNSVSCLIEGMKGWGKSTYAKSMTYRLSGLQAYDVLGNLEEWRTRITVRKSEEGSGEYDKLMEFLHVKIHKLGQGDRINLLGLLRRPTDLINATINLVQEIGKQYDNPKISIAVYIAVMSIFAEDSRLAGERLIARRLKALVLQDFKDHYKADREATKAMFAQEFAENPELLTQLRLDDESVDVVDESFVDAAQHAARCLEELMGSNYGNVFGGKDSLYEILAQTWSVIDEEEMPENARTALSAILMLAEASAIRYAKEDIGTANDMTKIVPKVNVHEEVGDAANSLMWLRYAANKQNKSRAYSTADWYLAQYDTQVSEAGSVGTEKRNLSKQLSNGFDQRILFRQPSDDTVLQRFSKELGWSDQDVEKLTQLNIGEGILWVRDKPTVRFQHLLFDFEVPIVESNSARQRGARSTPVWSLPEMHRRLEVAHANNVELASSF